MNILIRNFPEKIHRKIKSRALANKRSFNQEILSFYLDHLGCLENNEERKQKHEEAFRRLDELREKIRKKYGRTEDSTKIIRHFRDTRIRGDLS
jgi:plasmid stability protein